MAEPAECVDKLEAELNLMNPVGVTMKKRTGKSKKVGPKKDLAWFKRKVAELKTELEKLPADRQEQLKRELEEGSEQ